MEETKRRLMWPEKVRRGWQLGLERKAVQSPVPVGAGQVTEGSDGRQVHTIENAGFCSKLNRAEPV